MYIFIYNQSIVSVENEVDVEIASRTPYNFYFYEDFHPSIVQPQGVHHIIQLTEV